MNHFNRSKVAVSLALLFAGSSGYAAEQDGVDEVEKIQITGSRIQRSTAGTPTPTTIIDSAQIALSGVTNVGDILRDLPAFTGGSGRLGTESNGQLVGVELADLRGLGTNRTLVLVNGRRHIGNSPGDSSVDLNSIPSNLVQRVEVITGAASAVYGADAVSGVINFIMKKDYVGTQVNVQYGESAQGDDENSVFSIVHGLDFNSGKGNAAFTFEYNDRKEVRQMDRDFASKGLSWVNANDPRDPEFDPNNPPPYEQKIVEDLRFLPLSAEGIVAADPGFGPIGELGVINIDENGNVTPFDTGLCFGIKCVGGKGFSIHEYGMISQPSERVLATTSINYALNDSHSVFFDAKYSKTKAQTTSQPAISDGYFGPFAIAKLDNPYIPQSVHEVMVAQGIEQLFIRKAHADLGKLPNNNTLELAQFVFGGSGEVNDDISYNFYAQYGSSEQDDRRLDRVTDKYVQALDAVRNEGGEIVCRDSSNGCAPLNPFGLNAASMEAVGFVMQETGTKSKITQTVLSASIDGSLYSLPYGDMLFAVGAEYREETSEAHPDEILRTARVTNAVWNAPLNSVEGEYDVTEVYGELYVPLISDVYLVNDLVLETAFRLSDYSSVGEHTAYKLGLDWTVNPSLRIRASHGLAVRAPNINELFSPESSSPEHVEDPCDIDRINSPKDAAIRANRVKNCAARGVPENFNSLADGASQPVFKAGNRNLKPEESTTFTYGFVFTPESIDNFSVGIDYWKIEIEDAIATVSTNSILSRCVDSSSIDNQYCQAISRGEDGNYTKIVAETLNIARLEAAGYDLEAHYGLDMAEAGELKFNLVASLMEENKDYYDAEDLTKFNSRVDTRNRPKVKGNLNVTYDIENVQLHLGFRYLGSSKYDNKVADNYYAINKVDSVLYTNMRAAYSWDDNLEMYFGVNNLTDKKPQAIPGIDNGSVMYDAIGRSYYAGVNYSF